MEKRKVKNGNVYIIKAYLQKFDNQLPYFSVTHEVWHATKKKAKLIKDIKNRLVVVLVMMK